MGCGSHPKRLIVVTGATGMQGGSVINALLKYHSDEFIVRAVTRNPEKAKDLANRGVEVVKGDYDDLNSLKKAFDGAYGVFCVTNFWEIMDAEKEKRHAKNLADACQANNVFHVIWSTLEDTRSVLNGKASALSGTYTVPHFDGKFEANEYFTKLPTTYFYTSFYYENFTRNKLIQKNENNYTIAFNMGDATLPMVALEDIGQAAAGIFNDNKMIGKNAYIASDILTCDQIATVFSKHLGGTCSYYKMSDDDYRKLPFPGAHEFANMFAYKREDVTNFSGNRKSGSKLLVSAPISFDSWLSKNKKNILS